MNSMLVHKDWKQAHETRRRRLAWVQRMQEVMLALERHGAPPPDDLGLGHLDWALPDIGIVRISVTLGTDINFSGGIGVNERLRVRLGERAADLLPASKDLRFQLDTMTDPSQLDDCARRWAAVLQRFWDPARRPTLTEPTADHFTPGQDRALTKRVVDARNAPYFDPSKGRQ